jgi:hypothetical protein
MCKKLEIRYSGLICLIFVLVLSFAVKSAFGELVAFYPMNEGFGTVIADASGYGHDGVTLVEPNWVDGPPGFGMALNFDGRNPAPAWVDCGTWNPSEETGQLTVMLWLKWDGVNSNWQGVVAKRDGWGTEEDVMWYLEMNSGTGAIFFARMGQTGAAAEDPPPIGQWQHVAVSFDGTTATMYIDGEEAVSGPFSFGPGVDTTVMIGADNLGGANGFNGTIDEVRIYNTALTQDEIQTDMWQAGYVNELALNPYPKDKKEEVPRDIVLGWRPGGLVVTHNVYFGTDPNDVNDATMDDPRGVLVGPSQTEATYQSADLLDYGVTYYWRVDEVNDLEPNSPWKGGLWSFTTVNFLVVEDFEDYNDFPPNEIFNTWVDGWDDPTNGSTSGYPNPDFVGGGHYLEDDIVHGGQFSLPLYYDNGAGLSWATRTLTAADKDWTRDDVITLTIFYQGDAQNEVVPMYVALDDYAVVTHPEPRAVMIGDWLRWDILLQDFADMGVNLTNVNSITLGFGDPANPTAGGEGRVFFDDIRLYRSQPEEYVPRPDSVNPGTANLVAYYDFENDVQDNSGKGRHGTAFNNLGYTTGATGFGLAVQFNGVSHYISLPIGSLIASLDNITVACWADFSNEGGSWQRLWDFGVTPEADSDPNIYMFITPRSGGTGPMQFGITTGGNNTQSNLYASEALPPGWHHVAASIDSSTMTVRLYQNGELVAEGETSFLPSDLGATNQNYIGRSQWEGDAYYNGAIDEFRIYNRVLTEAELLFLMGW